jgi:hypothetical protein
MMTTKAGGCEIHVGYAHTQASKQLNLLACLIRKSDDDSDEAVQHGVDAVEQLLRHAIGELSESSVGAPLAKLHAIQSHFLSHFW